MSIFLDKNMRTTTSDLKTFELSSRLYNVLLNIGYENLSHNERELLLIVSKIYNERINERK